VIRPMTDEEAKRAIEKAKANRFDEYGNYGENNGPVGETKEEPEMVVSEYGNRWWYLDGKLHRKDGPAVEHYDGTKRWYLNGKRHREDGPAVEWANGDKFWFLNGKRVTEEEVIGKDNPCVEVYEEYKAMRYAEFVESMILTYGQDRLAENTLGLVGEAGEVAEKVKKYFRDTTLDKEAIQKELGDVIFYWYALHGALDLDPQETIDTNMEKLSSRKKRGTLQGSGDNR